MDAQSRIRLASSMENSWRMLEKHFILSVAVISFTSKCSPFHSGGESASFLLLVRTNQFLYSLPFFLDLHSEGQEVFSKRIQFTKTMLLFFSFFCVCGSPCSAWPAGRVRWRGAAEAALQRAWRASVLEGKHFTNVSLSCFLLFELLLYC